MNLDPRIKDILYIADCFTTDNYQKYVGTECYMTDFIDRFRDLSMCKKAVLTRIADGLDTPYVSDGDYFRFCLASVFVEQKQTELRPFTLSEFNERFEFGDYIMFRLKDRTRSFCVPYNGNEYRSETEDDSDDDDGVHLGAYAISLQDLFNDYEYRVGDEWKPFGVETVWSGKRMKLDKRVKENALIGHCFNSEELKRYIGQVCYFVDALEDFSDLINPFEGVLKAVSPDAVDCYVAEAKVNGSPAEFSYAFCLPAVFVEKKPEEKKYRPYTIEEFCNEGFEIVIFREKDIPLMEYHVRYNGYKKYDNVYNVILGNLGYAFSDLFENFERFYNGRWFPFGVED